MNFILNLGPAESAFGPLHYTPQDSLHFTSGATTETGSGQNYVMFGHSPETPGTFAPVGRTLP